MTKTERLKSHHLNLCRFRPGSWEKRFCRNMAWSAEHAPETALTPKQQWTLDLMVHRFRRQLAGRLPDELMLADPPDPHVYGISAKTAADQDQSGTVQDLFTGETSKPHKNALEIPRFLLDPQAKLF